MSKRILIIDDELSIREALAGILEDEGFAAAEQVGLERSHLHKKLKSFALIT